MLFYGIWIASTTIEASWLWILTIVLMLFKFEQNLNVHLVLWIQTISILLIYLRSLYHVTRICIILYLSHI